MDNLEIYMCVYSTTTLRVCIHVMWLGGGGVTWCGPGRGVSTIQPGSLAGQDMEPDTGV